MASNDKVISRKNILVEDDRTGTSLETLRRAVLDNLILCSRKVSGDCHPQRLLHDPGLHCAGSTVAPLAQNGWNLAAYVMPTNTGMIKLFKKLPYKITTKIESDMLILSCNFDEEN